MRRKLALAAAGLAAAASFAPVPSAAAVCWDLYYELTGKCSPCSAVGGAVHRVQEKIGHEVVSIHCLA